MTASGRFSSSSFNSLPMSSRSSFALWISSKHTVDWSGSENGIRPGRAWSSIFLFSFFTLLISAHSQDTLSQNRTALNQQIYYEAFKTLNSTDVKTGLIYTSLTSSIADEALDLVQMVRLRSGSLTRYGVTINEIVLPKGVRVVQEPERVVLVYRRFKEYQYYNATPGNVFVSPIVGILAYDAKDVTNFTNYGAELALVAEGSPIHVQLQSSRKGNNNLACVRYDNTVNGSATGSVENTTSPDSCTWTTLGDYSLLGPPGHKKSNTWKIVVGAICGAIFALLVLCLIALLAVKYKKRSKFRSMEHKSEHGETLNNTLVGSSRAPAAASTRTRPTLENE